MAAISDKSTYFNKQKMLYKICLKDDSLCSFFNSSEGTIIHILWECPKVQELLDNFGILWKRKNIEFPKESCILSYSEVYHPVVGKKHYAVVYLIFYI